MSGGIDFDIDHCVNVIRNNSRGFQKAKAEYSSIRELRYTDLTCTNRDMGELGAVLKNASVYIDRVVRGGHAGLASPVFIIDYDLRANLLKAAEYAIECVNLSFRVEWNVVDVRVELYPGVATNVIVTHELAPMMRDGKARDLTKFASATGLGMKEVRDDNSRNMPLLMDVFQSGSVGQNKLTRLVKGCLMYIDRLELGPTTVRHAELSTMKYNVESLIGTLDLEDTAFVYTKHDTAPSHNLILYSMCQSYPSPYLGGADHVHIPADGRYIVLVGNNPTRYCQDTYVSAELIMGTMIEYAEYFCLGNQIEAAMAIACSLRQNRYFKVVGLPSVLSGCDVIAPALGRLEAGVTEKTMLSIGAATMLGRFHQMSCLVLIKDVLTSVRNTSRNNYFLYDNIRDVLSRDRFTLLEYLEDKTFSGMLKISMDMQWLPYLDDEAMKSFDNISIFEGFWVVNNPLTALKDGAIRCLKKGVKKAISLHAPGLFMDSFDTLYNEVVLGGGDENFNIPDGGYTISVSNIRCLRRPKPIEDFEFEVDVDLTVPCENSKAPPAPKRFSSEPYSGWEVGSDSEEVRPTRRTVPHNALPPIPRAPARARAPPPLQVPFQAPAQESLGHWDDVEDDPNPPVVVRPTLVATGEVMCNMEAMRVALPGVTMPVAGEKETTAGEQEESGDEGTVVAETTDLPPVQILDESPGLDKSTDTPFVSCLVTQPVVIAQPSQLPRSGVDVILGQRRFTDGSVVRSDDSGGRRGALRPIVPQQSSGARVGRPLTQHITHLGKDEFQVVDAMRVYDFVNDRRSMSIEMMELRDYLLCLPQYTYAGEKIWKFRAEGDARNKLMECVEVWNTHKQGRIEDFSESWRSTILELREKNLYRVEAYEWPKATDEEVDSYRGKPLLHEALSREDDFQLPAGKTLEDLRGINKFCGAFDWWTVEACRICKLNDRVEVLTESSKKWLADYVDKGGHCSAFGEVWRMVKDHALFKSMDWHLVSGEMKDIIKHSKKRDLKVNFRNDSKQKSIDYLCRTDSFTADKMSRYISKEKYNDAVYRMMEVSLAKMNLLLHQLAVTGKMITRPEYYVIAYRSTRQEANVEYKLKSLLSRYVD